MKAATAGVQRFVSLIEFQSTPPEKAATSDYNIEFDFDAISIHAAREGGDDIFVTRRECEEHFNPRRP